MCRNGSSPGYLRKYSRQNVEAMLKSVKDYFFSAVKKAILNFPQGYIFIQLRYLELTRSHFPTCGPKNASLNKQRIVFPLYVRIKRPAGDHVDIN